MSSEKTSSHQSYKQLLAPVKQALEINYSGIYSFICCKMYLLVLVYKYAIQKKAEKPVSFGKCNILDFSGPLKSGLSAAYNSNKKSCLAIKQRLRNRRWARKIEDYIQV